MVRSLEIVTIVPPIERTQYLPPKPALSGPAGGKIARWNKTQVTGVTAELQSPGNSKPSHEGIRV